MFIGLTNLHFWPLEECVYTLFTCWLIPIILNVDSHRVELVQTWKIREHIFLFFVTNYLIIIKLNETAEEMFKILGETKRLKHVHKTLLSWIFRTNLSLTKPFNFGPFGVKMAISCWLIIFMFNWTVVPLLELMKCQ